MIHNLANMPCRLTAPALSHVLAHAERMGKAAPLRVGGWDKDGVRQELADEPQLLALHDLFHHRTFADAASSHEIIWGHVKGFPWWPVRSVRFASRSAPSGAAWFHATHC